MIQSVRSESVVRSHRRRAPRNFIPCGVSALLALALLTSGCNRGTFPDVPSGYREFAYVSNGASNTVSVLDLVYMRQDRTLQVGTQPTGMAINPKRNEVYVVNAGTSAGNGSISVIDTDANEAWIEYLPSTAGLHDSSST